MNINDIMKMIPHRYPFLLVDKVLEMEEGVSIKGLKNVTMNEPHFTGHFVDDPIMPGVLMLEALAQVSAILAASILKVQQTEKQVILMSINNAKFRRIVRPGDSLILHSNVLQSRGNVWKFSCKAEVEGEVAAECELMAMIKDKE